MVRWIIDFTRNYAQPRCLKSPFKPVRNVKKRKNSEFRSGKNVCNGTLTQFRNGHRRQKQGEKHEIRKKQKSGKKHLLTKSELPARGITTLRIFYVWRPKADRASEASVKPCLNAI